MNRVEALDNKATFKQNLSKYGIYVVIVLLIILFSFSNPEFLTVNNFLLMLQQLSPLGIAVIGMTYVLFVGNIDISVGRVMYVSCVVVGEVIRALPENILSSPLLYLICFAIVIAIGAAFGLVNGLLVAKLNIFPFLVTLVTGYIARGIGLTIAGVNKYDVSILAPVTNARVGGIPIVFIVFIVLALLMEYVLRYRRFGKNSMAVGNNRVAAKHVGINVEKHQIYVHVLCSIMAAIGGLFSAGQISEVFTTFGENNEFSIITAAVIGGVSLFGGKGSVLLAALIGMFLVQLILNGLSMFNASVYVYNIVRGLIIFLAVMLDSVNNKGELR